ncbi:MAG: 50S ribosomal protein L28 [Verrucomicrobiota bacterium]|nr:50S ribosomal protein L28 [Verrucomicrobiota bacterium]
MPRSCAICGKSLRRGNRIVRHGLAKRKGGIGLHTTGISRRLFAPNLQRIRVIENGGVVRRRVCTRCIKSGRITKA